MQERSLCDVSAMSRHWRFMPQIALRSPEPLALPSLSRSAISAETKISVGARPTCHGNGHRRRKMLTGNLHAKFAADMQLATKRGNQRELETNAEGKTKRERTYSRHSEVGGYCARGAGRYVVDAEARMNDLERYSPPHTRCVRSRYMDYDRLHPRTSSPIAFSRNTLPSCGRRDSFSFRTEASTHSDSGRESSLKHAPQSPKSPMAQDKLNEVRKTATPSESLIRIPFQDALPDKECELSTSSAFQDSANHLWKEPKKSPQLSPSEPFTLQMEPVPEDFTEYRRIGPAHEKTPPTPPPLFQSILNNEQDPLNSWTGYFRKSTDVYATKIENGAERAKPTQRRVSDVGLQDVTGVEAAVARSKTLQDVTAILQVADEVCRSNQHLTKGNIAQLGFLYKEADAVLRSIAQNEPPAIFRGTDTLHTAHQQLTQELQEHEQILNNTAGDISKSKTLLDVSRLLEAATEKSQGRNHQQFEGSAALLKTSNQEGDANSSHKTQLDVSAILQAADVIGDLCAPDPAYTTGKTAMLISQRVDKKHFASVEQGDSLNIRDDLERHSRKPSASGEGRSQEVIDGTGTASPTNDRQHRKRCRHKLDHLHANSSSTSGTVTMDPSVEILSLPTGHSTTHCYRNSLRQESSVVLVDFVPTTSQSVFHQAKTNPALAHASLTHTTLSSTGSLRSASASLSDDVAGSTSGDDCDQEVVEKHTVTTENERNASSRQEQS
ncbi:hypothetical protein BIW11_08072 [Tropilaelaps mercedesae]|uniref:Uncharacterized protein n=1 Tax=Tropilaelaps mercedesae TaxID=418985 RepID=A0A1V9XR50_9ACAR|nr:hypothetical protein BIW11_08072 [Tropilaelaps mercedesae]